MMFGYNPDFPYPPGSEFLFIAAVTLLLGVNLYLLMLTFQRTTMTKQEIFTAVATHLLTQNRKALLHDESECAYRAADNAKCAVGVLIKDEFYSSELEHKRVDNPLVLAALEKSLGGPLQNDEINLLKALQHLHDLSDPMFWAERLPCIAKQHKVRYEVDSRMVVA